MKKAIKINISGVIFHIDEDAYEKLKQYLRSVELYFSAREGGKEIVDDIESRIAELFQSRVNEQKAVITIEDVTEVTSIMGDPSDIIDEAGDDEPGQTGQKETARTSARASKRLYRDPENAVLGGVCGGLGAYFGMDPVIIRVLFVILLIVGHGVWGLVYIVLWIAIPKAVSIAQKLEMRGERVTISNIEKTVKQEYEDVKTNFRKIEKSEGYRQATSAVGEIFQVIGRIVVVLAKVLLVLIGVALVFAGMILLMGFLGVFFFKSTVFSLGWFDGSLLPLNQFLSAFIDPVNHTIILLALFFAVFIPLIAVIYGGIKLFFRISSRDRGIGIFALIVWVASISVLFTLGLIESRKYFFHGVARENIIVTPPESKVLYLKMNESINISSLEELTLLRVPERGIFVDPEKETIYSRPSLIIRQVPGNEPELTIERRARGSSQFYAEIKAENIIYNLEVKDSILLFDNLFTVQEGEKLDVSEIFIRLGLPEGHYVDIGDRMDRIITSARTADRVRVPEMTGKRWIMTDSGLKRD